MVTSHRLTLLTLVVAPANANVFDAATNANAADAAPEGANAGTPPSAPLEGCGWAEQLALSDADASGGLSRSEYFTFLTSIDDPPYVSEYFGSVESFDKLPWALLAVHKSLACHCQQLGFGEGCCEGDDVEVPIPGSVGNDSVDKRRTDRFRDMLCNMVSYAVEDSVPSPYPTLRPSVIPTPSPSDGPTESPSTKMVSYAVEDSVPSPHPTLRPSVVPTQSPSDSPTESPSTKMASYAVEDSVTIPYSNLRPSAIPTQSPSESPTGSPLTGSPSAGPTSPPSPPPATPGPTESLVMAPTAPPTSAPSLQPSQGDVIAQVLSVPGDPSDGGGGMGVGGIASVAGAASLLIAVATLLANRHVRENRRLRKFAGDQAPEDDLEAPPTTADEDSQQPEPEPSCEPHPAPLGPEEDDESSTPSMWSEGDNDESGALRDDSVHDYHEAPGMGVGSSLAAMGVV